MFARNRNHLRYNDAQYQKSRKPRAERFLEMGRAESAKIAAPPPHTLTTKAKAVTSHRLFTYRHNNTDFQYFARNFDTFLRYQASPPCVILVLAATMAEESNEAWRAINVE